MNRPMPKIQNVSKEFENAIINALRETKIEELRSSAFDLGILREIKFQNERLTIEIVLPSFGLKSEKNIAFAIKKVVEKFPFDPKKVDLNFFSDVKPAAEQSIKTDEIADVRNVILVASGKGGVGKSTVASNIAVTLASLGCRVGLLDADVYGPSVPKMFGVEEEGQVKAFRDEERKNTFMIPPVKHDVSLMSLGFLVDTESPMIWRGPMIASASMQMFNNVCWGQLDYLIVDLPPGTGDIQLTIAQKINVAGAVIVSTPQDIALQDVIRAKKMFEKVNIETLGLVENMSYFVCDSCDKRHEIFSNGGAKKMAEELSLPVLGEIPLVANMRQAADDGEPWFIKQERHPAKDQFLNICHEIVAQLCNRVIEGKVAKNVQQNAIPQPKPADEKKRRLPVL